MDVSGWPVAHAGVAVVSGSGTAMTGDVDRVFAWASVTKLVTALAVHIAARESYLGLDDEYGPPGATVRHLLAHASGLPFEGTEPLGRLAARRVYSNSGFDLLGTLLSERTGAPVAQVLGDLVLEPLGLERTSLTGRPSAGLAGPVRDLAALAAELRRPTLLSAAEHRAMTSVAWPELTGVLPGYGSQRPNPWALGPEVRGDKTPHWTAPDNDPRTFGHFGQAGGFLWVDPAADLACCSLSSEPFGPWAVAAWPALSTRVLLAGGAPDDLAGWDR